MYICLALKFLIMILYTTFYIIVMMLWYCEIANYHYWSIGLNEIVAVYLCSISYYSILLSIPLYRSLYRWRNLQSTDGLAVRGWWLLMGCSRAITLMELSRCQMFISIIWFAILLYLYLSNVFFMVMLYDVLSKGFFSLPYHFIRK